MIEEKIKINSQSTYYCPLLEEFYVGFEYERCDSGYEYIKDTFPRAIELDNFVKHYDRYIPYIRVKYLDSDDIQDVLNNPNSTVLPGTMMLPENDIWCIYYRGALLFKGTIKNKSELKKLMQQLNIQL